MPTEEQARLLLSTLKEANLFCNKISEISWGRQVFNKYKLHKEVYHDLKSKSNLGSQIFIRCISKVADAYKRNKNCKQDFGALGGIAYDSRILSYKRNYISIWSIAGRLKIPIICHNPNRLPYAKGEADLIFKKGKFYLYQTVDIPNSTIEDPDEFLGVDFGLTDIAVTSRGQIHSGKWINQYREKRMAIRSSIQRKGTRNSKKLLKRLSSKERTTATIINHTISKTIVDFAKKSGIGISIEDLSNFRTKRKPRNKQFKARLERWSFGQLRRFIEYKAELQGVKLVAVNPSYTSKTCSSCHHIGIRNNKSFKCKNCGNNMDADYNAALNIATLGAAVNHPEKSSMYSCTVQYSDLKRTPTEFLIGA